MHVPAPPPPPQYLHPSCLLLTSIPSIVAARPRPLVALARPASVTAIQAQDSLRRASSASLPQAADDGSSDDEGNIVYAEWHSSVSIMFTDIVGFTDMANQAHPHQVGAGRLLRWYRVRLLTGPACFTECACVAGLRGLARLKNTCCEDSGTADLAGTAAHRQHRVQHRWGEILAVQECAGLAHGSSMSAVLLSVAWHRRQRQTLCCPIKF